MSSAYLRPSLPSSSSMSSIASSTPLITYSLPTVDSLLTSTRSLDSLSDVDQLNWAQHVLRVLDRHLFPAGLPSDFSSQEARPSSSHIPATLNDLLNQAIPIVLSFTSHPHGTIAAMASYLKGKLSRLDHVRAERCEAGFQGF